MKAKINATVRTIPHPDPQRLIDLWSQIVLKELLRREQEADLNNG
ncbi:hypothetical protein NST83_01060 [Paenibacillus sp. FSL R10-2782]